MLDVTLARLRALAAEARELARGGPPADIDPALVSKAWGHFHIDDNGAVTILGRFNVCSIELDPAAELVRVVLAAPMPVDTYGVFSIGHDGAAPVQLFTPSSGSAGRTRGAFHLAFAAGARPAAPAEYFFSVLCSRELPAAPPITIWASRPPAQA